MDFRDFLVAEVEGSGAIPSYLARLEFIWRDSGAITNPLIPSRLL
ncbi:unnamed protein product [marine sediment metagenome]|uniref:Uncharacterized protein n=1 Tax=marine sediment metagenome TaxID=412755 RepID=X0VJ70_9ZZZZ